MDYSNKIDNKNAFKNKEKSVQINEHSKIVCAQSDNITIWNE